MKIFLIVLVLGVVIFLALDQHVPSSKAPYANRRVVAIGDSLVQGVGSEMGGGFVKMLSGDLGLPIINLGKSGDTTLDVLERINEIEKYNPEVVILLVGGNDLLQAVPDPEIFANLEKIIDLIQGGGAQILLLGLENNLPGKKYGGRYKDLVEEKEVGFVSNVMGDLFGVREYMADGIHPNDRGYAIIKDKVKPSLVDLLD